MTRSFAWLDGRLERFERYALPLLRSGLGGTMLMAGVHKLVDPLLWTSYMAGMLRIFLTSLHVWLQSLLPSSFLQSL